MKSEQQLQKARIMYQRKLSATNKVTRGASALALAIAFLAPKPAAAVPFFEDLTATKVPTPDPACATSSRPGCYTSWLVATDLDSDGDMDVLLANGGGYYKADFAYNVNTNPNPPPSNEPSTVYLNDGLGNFTDATGPLFNGATSRLRQVGVADINGDGLKDIFQPGGYGKDLDKLWVQTAKGVFADKAAELLPAGLKSNTPGFHLGDLDGDGDLDIVTTDWATAVDRTPVFLTLYLNDGTGKFTLAEEQQDPDTWLKTDRFPATIPGSPETGAAYWGTRAIDLDFSDIDNDFDLDILVNMRNGISRILLNDGTAHFKDGNGKVYAVQDKVTGVTTTYSNYPMKQGPYVYNQELCDFDNDGDLDLILDNAGARPTGQSGNYTQVLVNDGRGVFTDETRARIFGETGSDDNQVKCADVNNDGNYDLLVASLAGASEKLLLSDGTGKFNLVPDAFPKFTDPSLGIDAADFDGDGLFDVWTGQGEVNNGSFIDRYYHGVAALDGTGAKPDTKAPTFRAIEKPTAIEGQPIVVRFAVRDAFTSETGDMVKEASVVYSTPFGTSGKVPATFIGGDLFRAVIPAQAVYTTITVTPQATDRRNLKGFGSSVAITVTALPSEGEGEGGAGGGDGGGEPSGGGAGGEPPIVSEGGAAGAPVEPGSAGMSSEPEPGMGGTGEEPGSSGTSTGATSGSTGTPSEGGAPSDGGAPSAGGTGGKPSSSGDDGCSVSSTAASSTGAGWLAAFGLALMAGRRRRKRSEA